MLGLVLGDEVEDEAAGRQGVGVLGEVGPGEGLERPRAHVAEVAPGACLVEDRDLGAAGAGGLDRVVDVLELRVQRRGTGEAPHQPELLVGRDVAEVPERRAQQRRVLAREVLGGERREQGQGPGPGGLEAAGDLRGEHAHQPRMLDRASAAV